MIHVSIFPVLECENSQCIHSHSSQPFSSHSPQHLPFRSPKCLSDPALQNAFLPALLYIVFNPATTAPAGDAGMNNSTDLMGCVDSSQDVTGQGPLNAEVCVFAPLGAYTLPFFSRHTVCHRLASRDCPTS
jgi:hypothetical protein